MTGKSWLQSALDILSQYLPGKQTFKTQTDVLTLNNPNSTNFNNIPSPL
jgi:hypothetical protein